MRMANLLETFPILTVLQGTISAFIHSGNNLENPSLGPEKIHLQCLHSSGQSQPHKNNGNILVDNKMDTNLNTFI